MSKAIERAAMLNKIDTELEHLARKVAELLQAHNIGPLFEE